MTEQSNSSDPRRFYSRPADESLAAFKDWIIDMARALGNAEPEEIAEERWIWGWKKFWGGADETVAGRDQARH